MAHHALQRAHLLNNNFPLSAAFDAAWRRRHHRDAAHNRPRSDNVEAPSGIESRRARCREMAGIMLTAVLAGPHHRQALSSHSETPISSQCGIMRKPATSSLEEAGTAPKHAINRENTHQTKISRRNASAEAPAWGLTSRESQRQSP